MPIGRDRLIFGITRGNAKEIALNGCIGCVRCGTLSA